MRDPTANSTRASPTRANRLTPAIPTAARFCGATFRFGRGSRVASTTMAAARSQARLHARRRLQGQPVRLPRDLLPSHTARRPASAVRINTKTHVCVSLTDARDGKTYPLVRRGVGGDAGLELSHRRSTTGAREVVGESQLAFPVFFRIGPIAFVVEALQLVLFTPFRRCAWSNGPRSAVLLLRSEGSLVALLLETDHTHLGR